ncbi:MAG: hypothetical protein V8Q42_03575 [Anaerovoracaceae bacterium]
MLTKKILMGGPMMGRAAFSDELPVVKNNNAILAFDGPQALIPEETGCIKCGMCTGHVRSPAAGFDRSSVQGRKHRQARYTQGNAAHGMRKLFLMYVLEEDL